MLLAKLAAADFRDLAVERLGLAVAALSIVEKAQVIGDGDAVFMLTWVDLFCDLIRSFLFVLLIQWGCSSFRWFSPM